MDTGVLDTIMQNKSNPKQSRSRCIQSFVFAITTVLFVYPADAQVVQLPTTGSFSIQSGVSVPDSGSAYAGGYRSGAIGSQSQGPLGRSAYGSQTSSASASVRATIIDLGELDRMILSQAGTKPAIPELENKDTPPPKYVHGDKAFPAPNAQYEYLAALSNDAKAAPSRVSEDTRYYLSLAQGARQKGHWHAVELYYKLAWESLPLDRRENALVALANARSQPEKKETNKSKSR